MSNNTLDEVVIFIPDKSVISMARSAIRHSVAKVVETAQTVYGPVQTNGVIKIKAYGNDFEDAVAAAIHHADTTAGDKLLVIVTDLYSLQGRKAGEALLAFLNRWVDGVVVIVPVGRSGHNRLTTRFNNLDFIYPKRLANPHAATAKLAPFLADSDEADDDTSPEYKEAERIIKIVDRASGGEAVRAFREGFV